MSIVVISGGFDPIHIGHIRMIAEAAKLGDKLIAVVNNDNWLKTKKGFCFMNETERVEIVSSIKGVDEVILTNHEPDCSDMSICETLKNIKFDIFANGGDRYSDNIPEYELCKKLNVAMIFNIGGEKIRSSSELIKKALK